MGRQGKGFGCHAGIQEGKGNESSARGDCRRDVEHAVLRAGLAGRLGRVM